MAKNVAINFWEIFSRYENEKTDGPKIKEDLISPGLLKKIQSTGNKVIVFSDKSMEVENEGGRTEPEFQEMFIEAIMKKRLEDSQTPFDTVSYGKPKDIDIEIDYKIKEYKNWESVLIDKLKEK